MDYEQERGFFVNLHERCVLVRVGSPLLKAKKNEQEKHLTCGI
jgi:hypothetical protein